MSLALLFVARRTLLLLGLVCSVSMCEPQSAAAATHPAIAR